jgi:hypothetical protein
LIFGDPLKKRRSAAAVQNAARLSMIAMVSFDRRQGYDGAHGVARVKSLKIHLRPHIFGFTNTD